MLELIALGRKTEILFEKKRNKTLNWLQEFRLIEVTDLHYVLTEQGRIAREIGVEAYLECENLEKDIGRFSLERSRQRAARVLNSFYLLLVLLMIILVVNVQGVI